MVGIDHVLDGSFTLPATAKFKSAATATAAGGIDNLQTKKVGHLTNVKMLSCRDYDGCNVRAVRARTPLVHEYYVHPWFQRNPERVPLRSCLIQRDVLGCICIDCLSILFNELPGLLLPDFSWCRCFHHHYCCCWCCFSQWKAVMLGTLGWRGGVSWNPDSRLVCLTSK